MVITEKKWCIMTKDRKYIAKGTPRNREMVAVQDLDKDKKRFLTYNSKKIAENGFILSGFYSSQINYPHQDPKEVYEAVPVEITFKIVEE